MMSSSSASISATAAAASTLTGQDLVDPGVVGGRDRVVEVAGDGRRPGHGAALEDRLQPREELLRLDHLGIVVDRRRSSASGCARWRTTSPAPASTCT